MKSVLCTVIALALVFSLCACGDSQSDAGYTAPSSASQSSAPASNPKREAELQTEPMEHVLAASDADLSEAPNVVLEGDSFNLGGWLAEGNTVAFPLNVGYADSYLVEITYSKAHSGRGPDGGTIISLTTNPSEPIVAFLPPTGDSGDWSQYVQQVVGTIQLSAENYTLYIACTEPETSEYVMNLHSVRLIPETLGGTMPDGALSGPDPFTPENVDQLYPSLKALSFEKYWRAFQEDWDGYSESERRGIYGGIVRFAQATGDVPRKDYDTWAEDIAAYLGGNDNVWYCASKAMGLNLDALPNAVSLFYYAQGLEQGDDPPLHPEILATADSLDIAYGDDRLLCLNRNHSVVFINKEWTTAEDIFYHSGSVQPKGGDDLSLYVEGEDGRMTRSTLGGFDLMNVYAGMGALEADGSLRNNAIQICTYVFSDEVRLFVLTQDEAGVISIAILEYNEGKGSFAWDGQLITTTEQCCFSPDGEFCYIDDTGTMVRIKC